MVTGVKLSQIASGSGINVSTDQVVAVRSGTTDVLVDLSGLSGITIGTTTITSGTDTRVLFQDGSVVGEDAGFTYTKGTGTLALGSSGALAFSTNAFLTGKGAANLQFGAADAAAPVAQTLSFQSVATGTSNTNGADTTINLSKGTGTGNGGKLTLNVAYPGTTGTTQNSLTQMFTVAGSNGLIEIGDKSNNYSNASTIFSYAGSGFGGSGFWFRNNGATTTSGSASVSVQSGTTTVASIMNTGGYYYNGTNGKNALVINAAGNNFISIAASGNPSVGVLGYSSATNGATTASLRWREVVTAGSTSYLQFITPGDTNLTASTESIGIQYGGSTVAGTVIRTWATGALTTQRENVFIAPTYAFAGASTITTAATLAISGAPVAGTNATITNPYALWVQAGNSVFAGNLTTGANSGTNGQITFNGSTSGSCTLKVAAAAGTSTNFQLPSDNGTNTYILTTDGSGNTSWTAPGAATMAIGSGITSGTSGSVLYVNSSVQLAQDNSNFFWDATNHNLYLGTASPTFTGRLVVQGSAGSAGAIGAQIYNSNAGGEGFCAVRSDAGYLAVENFGSTFGSGLSSSGSITASSGLTGGFSFLVLANAPLNFATGGTAARMSISGTGVVNIAGLTASQAIFTDGSKNLVSNAITGSGNVVMSASPTLTGTVTAATVSATNVLNPNNAITASGNAATVPVTSRLSTVTNNSAATLTITITTTNAIEGQALIVRILDASAAAQTITWVNTENSTVSAPTTSNGSTTLPLTVGFQFNANTIKWRCIASA